MAEKIFTLPPGVSDGLFPHQREGVSWLVSHHHSKNGCILADAMGLGKTRQICAFMAGLFHSDMVKRVLVVIRPMSLKLWKDELKSVSLSGMARIYSTIKERTELGFALQDRCILITTYNVLRSNWESFRGDNHDTAWDYMFLDDGHEVRNRETQNSQNLAKVPCRYSVIITGAPFHNNLKDLWVLFHFCHPHLLGGEKEFVDKYEKVISKGNYKDASKEEKAASLAAAKQMRSRYKPFLLRRMKTGVHNFPIPKKYEVVVWLELNSHQRQAYEAIVYSKFKNSCHFAAITSLRKICDSTILLKNTEIIEVLDELETEEIDRRAYEEFKNQMKTLIRFSKKKEIGSSKIPFILNLVDHLSFDRHKILIYSQHREMLKQIKEVLPQKTELIDGNTSVNERCRISEDFQRGFGGEVLLLTSSAGGYGLTLTIADRVILVDPAWSPSVDNQSIDRTYRIGQVHDVVVYRLITCGTVEEKMYKKQVFKDGLSKVAYEEKEQTCYFDKEDYDDFLKVTEEGFSTSSTQLKLQEHELQIEEGSTLREHLDDLKTKENVVGVNLPGFNFSKGTLIDRDLKIAIKKVTEQIGGVKMTYEKVGPNTPDKGKKLLERINELQEYLLELKRKAAN